MKTINNSGFVTGLIFTALSFTACGQPSKSTEAIPVKGAGNGFAVLELFTSEGCSSCPPADQALAKIQREMAGKPVYLLAYHVDYWNRLGWKDQFSQPGFSKRQLAYGSWLNAQTYTPQLVVNGKNELVGSDRSAINDAISSQLAITPTASLLLKARQHDEKLHLHYQAISAAKGNVLVIAIVQKNARSEVLRGENAGHTLSHVQIVRQLQSVDLKGNGEGDTIVALPADFSTQYWEVLGLIQDQNNGSITAATKALFIADLTAKK